MPLIKSATPEAKSDNIKREMAAGKPQRQAIAIALDVARRAKRASGGAVHLGAIRSIVAGRTDHHPMEVPSGSYILPADHCSSLGEGNTESGFAVLEKMFPHSHALAKGSISRQSTDRRAEGGMISPTGDNVPIMAAGGEFVVSPQDIVARWGNLDHGHAALDAWVKTNRAKHIKTLKNLPGPAQS